MSTPAEDRRNATAMYNPYSLKEIKEIYPNVSKKNFLFKYDYLKRVLILINFLYLKQKLIVFYIYR